MCCSRKRSWPCPHTSFFQQIGLREFFTETRWSPQYAEEQRHYGIMPLVCGTFLITGISGLIGLPAGLMIAIYLSEYAAPRTRSICKPLLEILAGVPTVVYGYFALKFLTPYFIMPIFKDFLGLSVNGFNALSGGIVVGIMIIPMVASLSEDALRAVPRSLREGAIALGANKYETSTKVVLPAALSGVFASFMLAISRAIGETMVVTLACGNRPILEWDPRQGAATMTSFIAQVAQGDAPQGTTVFASLFAVALLLFVMTLLMNFAAQALLRRYRQVYQ